MSFDQLVALGQEFRKLRPRVGDSGMTALNLSEPIGAETLAETQQGVAKRAQQTYKAAVARGAPQEELDRLLALSGGTADPGDAMTTIFNALTLPGDLLKLGVTELMSGGVDPSSQDFQDIITLNKQRMIARNQMDPHSEWGRSGEFRGTDMLERMGAGYVNDAPGPWDEIGKGLRFVGATALDIFTDPLSFFTGGGSGVARSAAVNTAEIITTKTIKEAATLLKSFGDDALEVSIREVAEKGTSPLVLEAAERAQVKARKLFTDGGWKGQPPAKAIDEVIGLKYPDELVTDLTPDPKAYVETALGEPGKAGKVADELYTGVATYGKKGAEQETVWGQMNFHIGETVAKKQFHSATPTWKNYTEHVLYHMGEGRIPAAAGTIGGLSFMVPFVPSSARTFRGLTGATQGWITRGTRRVGGKLGPLSGFAERIGTSEWISDIRAGWQKFRRTKGREVSVGILRDPKMSVEARRTAYLGVVTTQKNAHIVGQLLAPLGVTAGVSTTGKKMIAQVNELVGGDKEMADNLFRLIGEAHVQGGKASILLDGIDSLGIQINPNQRNELTRTVEMMRKLQELGDKAYAEIDPKFRQMLDASDRTYTPLRVLDTVDKRVRNNRSAFDDLRNGFNRFVEEMAEGPERYTTDELVEMYARTVGFEAGITGDPLTASEFAMFIDFINGFKDIRIDTGLQALGSTQVLRLRRLGATARVIEEIDPTTGARTLRTVQDWNDLTLMDEKFTKMLNHFLPEGQKVKGTFETNPAVLVEHWYTSIHSAISESLMAHFMWKSKLLKDVDEHLVLVHQAFNRYARDGVFNETNIIIGKIYNALTGIEGDVIDPKLYDNIISHASINGYKVEVGGVEIEVPIGALNDAGFNRAIREADLYLSRLTGPGARNQAKALRALISEGQQRVETANQVMSYITQGLRNRHKRARNALRKSWSENIETQYQALGESLEAAGGTAPQQKALLDAKKRDYQKMNRQIKALDKKAEKAQEAIAKEAMETAINREMNQFVADIRTHPQVQTKYDVSARVFRNEEDFADLFVDVAEHRTAKIQAAVEARAEAPPEARAQYGIEANELRRVSEGIDQIPVEMVSSGDLPVTDAGWVKPPPGEADAWVEYYPGFGGSGYDTRSGQYSHPGVIERVWPEGRFEGEPAKQFAESLGWTGKSGQTIKDWWDESFLMIDTGVWKYTGNSSIPFYVLATQDALHGSIFRAELSQVWHEVNHALGPDQPLKPLRVWGLEATGLRPTAQAEVSPHLLQAIAEIRRRGYGAQGKSAIGALDSTKYVSAYTLYEEMIAKKAASMVRRRKVNKITLREAEAEARKKYLLVDFLDGHQHALVKPPYFVKRAERLNTAPYGGYQLREDPRSYAEVMDQTSLVSLEVYVSVPMAHEHNMELALSLGREDLAGLEPQDLFVALMNEEFGAADIARTPIGSVEPINPWQREAVSGSPSFNVDEARHAAGRAHYTDEYREWLGVMAETLGIVSPNRPSMSGLDIAPRAIWQFEDMFQELTGAATSDIFPNPIAVIEIADLPPDAEHLINQAYAHKMEPYYQRNPKRRSELERLHPYEKMMRLRAMGWIGDSEDLLGYSESPQLAEFKLGETPATAEMLEEFADEQEWVVAERVIRNNEDRLSTEYADIASEYRKAGKPVYEDTDNPFWGWLESHYPGTRAHMDATLSRARVSAEMEAGQKLLLAEKELALGPKPKATPYRRGQTSALREWRKAEAAFKSGFAVSDDSSPEVVWRNFYSKINDDVELPPKYAEILDRYERAKNAGTQPELLEKDIIRAHWSNDTLAEIDNDHLVGMVVDHQSAVEGKNRARMSVAEPIRDNGYRAEELMFMSDADRLALDEFAAGSADEAAWWRDDVRHDEANPTMEDLDPADVDQYGQAAPKGDDIRTGTLHAAGLKRRQHLLYDTLRGQTYVDMDLAEIGPYDGRFFTSAFEPKGSVRETGITGRQIVEAGDVSYQGRDAQPMSMPVSEDGQPIRHPVTGELMSYRELDEQGQPKGLMDELLADEWGEPARIGDDPRRVAEAIGRQDLSEIDRVTREGTQGRRAQTPTGFSGDMVGQGPVIVRRFAEQQGEMRRAFGELDFAQDSYLFAARRQAYTELVEEGDSHLMKIVGNNRNWMYHGLETIGVDMGKMMDSWNAFKETLNPVYLQDTHLKRGFAFIFSMQTLTKAPGGLTEVGAYLEAVSKAALDLDVRKPVNQRYGIRRQIEASFKPLKTTDDIFAAARSRKAYTSAVAVGSTEQKVLRDMQHQGRRMEAALAGEVLPEKPPTAPLVDAALVDVDPYEDLRNVSGILMEDGAAQIDDVAYLQRELGKLEHEEVLYMARALGADTEVPTLEWEGAIERREIIRNRLRELGEEPVGIDPGYDVEDIARFEATTRIKGTHEQADEPPSRRDLARVEKFPVVAEINDGEFQVVAEIAPGVGIPGLGLLKDGKAVGYYTGSFLWLAPEYRGQNLMVEAMLATRHQPIDMARWISMRAVEFADPMFSEAGAGTARAVARRVLADAKKAPDVPEVAAALGKAGPPAELEVIDAFSAVKRWDELDDDQLIEVLHSTDPETAERMLANGIVAGEKPAPMVTPASAQQGFAGATGEGLYVGANPKMVERFAGGRGHDAPRVTIRIVVPKSQITVPPEAAEVGRSIQKSLIEPAGGLILGDVPADRVIRMGDRRPEYFAEQVMAEEGLNYGGSGGMPSRYGTQVVNYHRVKRAQVDIRRSGDQGGKWGNPYTHDPRYLKDGMTLVDSPEQAVEMYHRYLLANVASGKWKREDIAALSGKSLGCVDAPGPCHGDVLMHYADKYAQELGLTLDDIPAAVDVDRGFHTVDNYGNPFYVPNKNNARYEGHLHPFFRYRAPDGSWRPVPYQAVKGNAAEAAARYYNMLYDMMGDPEYGAQVRAELVDRLHGRTLFAYGTGSNAESRTLEARILADAVDWTESGLYEATAAERAGVLFTSAEVQADGRPMIDNHTYYVSPKEKDTLDRMTRNVDMDLVDEWYRGFENRVAPAVDTQIEIDEERLTAELERNPALVRSVLEGPATYQEGRELTEFRQSVARVEAKKTPQIGRLMTSEVRAMRLSLTDKLAKVGIAPPDEMLRNLDHAFFQSLDNPVLTVLTQAARRSVDPRASFIHMPLEGPLDPSSASHANAFVETGGEARPMVLILQQPGSEQRSWLNNQDLVSVNANRGVSSSKPVKASVTLKNIHEMGEERAKQEGYDILWEMAEGQQSLYTQVDRLGVEIDQIKAEMKAGTADAKKVKRGAEAESQRSELVSAIKTLDFVTDLAWETSYTGANRRLRRRFYMQKPGDLPNGGEWDAYQRALAHLPEDRRLSIQFLVDSALGADLHPSFADFEAYWFEQKNVTVLTAKATQKALREIYQDAGDDPIRWNQLIGLKFSPVEAKLMSLMADWEQLIEIHPNRAAKDALFTELKDSIGVTSRGDPNASLGVNVNAAGKRKTFVELVDSITGILEDLERYPTLDILKNLGAYNLTNHDFARLKTAIDQLRLQPGERIAFGEGVQGSYLGLAGEIEDKMMNEFVAWEFYRSLNRMQMAADPRIGMEIMGAASDVMRWWSKAATVARVTFHMRNLISGMWNNGILGVGPAKALAMMPDVSRYIRNRRSLGNVELWGDDLKNMIDGYLLDGISAENREVFSRAIRAGVLDSAFASTLPRSISGAYGRRAWAPWNPDNKYFEWGTAGMEFVEGILRMAVFKHYYDPSYPFMTSMLGKAMVNMVHFDYSDMSAVDKYAKQFAPFWIWTSRNLPLQMRNMLGNPRMLLMYEHARQNWNDQFKDWDDENSSWLETGGRWILPFRQEDDMGNWVQLSWEPALPFNDLLETPLFKQTFNEGGPGSIVGDGALSPGLWLGWITGSLAPQYSAINDLVTNPRDQYKTTNAPPIFNHIFGALGAERTPQGDVRIPQFWNSVINTSIPFFTEYTELAGIASSSPYNAGNQGYLPGDYMARGGFQPRVPAQRLGRGLGFHWRSPEDIYWTYKDWEAYLDQQYFEERVALSEPIEPG